MIIYCYESLHFSLCIFTCVILLILLFCCPQSFTLHKESPQAHLHMVGMLWFDINQPSLPTPFYTVLVSVSVFKALSTLFYLINSLDHSLLSDCSSSLILGLLLFLTIPGYPSLACFFNSGDTKWTNSLKVFFLMFVYVLCRFVSGLILSFGIICGLVTCMQSR